MNCGAENTPIENLLLAEARKLDSLQRAGFFANCKPVHIGYYEVCDPEMPEGSNYSTIGTAYWDGAGWSVYTNSRGLKRYVSPDYNFLWAGLVERQA